jgi:AmmeMemoRadiSam system protein B
VATPLPRLRGDLDFMPSPVEDSPGLLIRDSLRYSDAILVIPPPLVPALACFDGQQTDLDLRKTLVQITGQLDINGLENHLTDALNRAGFLDNEAYADLKEQRRSEFASAPVRAPSHSGSAYPDDSGELRATLDHWMGPVEPRADLLGIAAPHVSPEGGYESYRSAYRLLGPEHKDRTFVILGTSHYGAPNRFGLTRKPWVTPFGVTQPNLALLDELAVARAVTMEDYCHSVEHSIEFQIVFLQSLYGPDIHILPILCGSYFLGAMPDDDENVRAFLGTLGEIAAREKGKLTWILGVDMAHMGRRYGDQFEALANQNEMLSVGGRDRDRMDRIAAGDARGFWERVRENHGDDLKWCGSSPFYTFLKACPEARGQLENYEQWNIDPASVVSFAGMSFRG